MDLYDKAEIRINDLEKKQPADHTLKGIPLREINDRPPNFEAIAAVFPGAHGEGVIFAYGNAIYNPNNTEIPPYLWAHERVHCERQLDIGVEVWWDRYLTDGQFRYHEELLAHRAEWKSMKDNIHHRHHRRKMLKLLAERLAHPLYGRMVSKEKALRDIRGF